MRKLVSMTCVLLLCIMQVFAQDKTVTGKVTDEKDGSPLPGVSVTVKGTTVGTVTGSDGTYRLSVPGSAKTLVFTFVNYETAELSIGNRSTINIGLSTNEKNLQEVVVTGYSREKKTQFTGAANVLSSKVVETVPVGAFDQALQGRAPGVLVNSGSGQPGSSANITIRGIKSISGAGVQPLYVIDGVPLPSFDMAAINPNDFESITILKDASAAALYGSRGALGVVVITTKKGKAGQNNFMYRTQIGITQPPSPSNFDQMSSREMLDYEEWVGTIVGGQAITQPGWQYSKLNPTYAGASATEKARRDFLRDSFANNNVNYYDILFRTGISQTHEINMSGGNSATKYFLSAGMFDQKGVDMVSRLKRYTTRFNLDNTVGKLNIQFNTLAAFAITNINEGAFYAGNGTANPFAMAWRAKPYENPYDANGNVLFGATAALSPKAIANLIDRANNSSWIDNQMKINSGLTLSYKLFPFLTVKNTLGLDLAIESATGTINANSYTGRLQTYQSGYLNESFRRRLQLINTTGALFNKRFGKSDLEVGAFFEAIRGYQKGFGLTMYNLDPRLTATGQGAGALTTGGAATFAQNGNSAKSGFGIRSYFATGRYTFDNKYTLTANIRRDGTSRILNPANKEVTTWAAGATWDAIKEDFLANQNILSDLKLRVSYGKTPNIGSIANGTAFGLSSNFYSITNYLGGQQAAYGAVAFAGSPLTAQAPTTPGNPDLRIETVAKTNIGVDLGFWKNRVRVTADFYREITNDLFVSQPLWAGSGFYGTSLPINAGVMSNKGVELVVSADIVKTKLIDVTIGANHAINNNMIEDLGLVNEYPLGTGIIKKGLPYGTHYTYNYLGADPATGRPMYEAPDGSTVYTINQAGLFHKFGTWLPKHVGGFTADIRIQRITISALFSYQFDVARYNNVQNWVTQGDVTYTNAVRQSKRLLTDQWRKPGDVKPIQSPAYSRQFTSFDVNDAKFLRFRNLNVGYNIPELNIKGFRLVKSARFYVQGQNLFIWSPWSGLDPEDDNNISLAEFPNPRAVVVGIDINF
nr:SusC/RagA family TonB-linked outer membrane protein [uncultured Lacibacter sp.]